jgi:hypothetical protein
MTVPDAKTPRPAVVDNEREPGLFDQAAFEELKAGVEGEIEDVTDELRHSYEMLSRGLARLEAEKAAALEDGDEMRYQAAEIKINLVLQRLRELESMQL